MPLSKIGCISDTHGLLRPQAIAALEGSDIILHAGDVGVAKILDSLQKIAPVYAVRGNVDYGEGLSNLPITEVVEFAKQHFYMIHILDDLDIDPAAAGMEMVIYGHSHIPSIEERNGVIFLNPGSAGRRRYDLPVTVAQILIRDGKLEPVIIDLQTMQPL
ncbi:MAG: metallophosphoesterase family protein [Calditrichaeota bacterium]|nr:metallophosphoesterase family protein [Calditrichota bacterium]MCB0266620.1 metallophosphoesterase family protein [Calditrichota bacterium]